jgi:hypothetical protein
MSMCVTGGAGIVYVFCERDGGALVEWCSGCGRGTGFT